MKFEVFCEGEVYVVDFAVATIFLPLVRPFTLTQYAA